MVKPGYADVYDVVPHDQLAVEMACIIGGTTRFSDGGHTIVINKEEIDRLKGWSFERRVYSLTNEIHYVLIQPDRKTR